MAGLVIWHGRNVIYSKGWRLRQVWTRDKPKEERRSFQRKAGRSDPVQDQSRAQGTLRFCVPSSERGSWLQVANPWDAANRLQQCKCPAQQGSLQQLKYWASRCDHWPADSLGKHRKTHIMSSNTDSLVCHLAEFAGGVFFASQQGYCFTSNVFHGLTFLLSKAESRRWLLILRRSTQGPLYYLSTERNKGTSETESRPESLDFCLGRRREWKKSWSKDCSNKEQGEEKCCYLSLASGELTLGHPTTRFTAACCSLAYQEVSEVTSAFPGMGELKRRETS